MPKDWGWRLKAIDDDLLAAFEPNVEDADFFDAVAEGWYPDCRSDGNGDTIYPIDPDAGIEWEGFGRLMRINCEGIWVDDERFEDGLDGFERLMKIDCEGILADDKRRMIASISSRQKRLRRKLCRVTRRFDRWKGSVNREPEAGCTTKCCVS